MVSKFHEAERPYRTTKYIPGSWSSYIYPVETFSAKRLNGYWAEKYPPPKKFEEGIAREYPLFIEKGQQVVYFSVNSTGSKANPHCLIAGKSQESGKTTLTNIILREEMARGAFAIVFDPKGEYYQLNMYTMKIKKVSFESWESPLKLKPSMLTLDDWRLIIDKYLSGEGTKAAFHLVRRCALDLKRRNERLDFESLQVRIKEEKGRGFTSGKWDNMIDTIDVFFEDLRDTNLFDEQTGIDIEQLIKDGYSSLVLDIAAPDDSLHVSLAAHNIMEQIFKMKTKNDPQRNRKYEKLLWEKRIWVVIDEAADPVDGLINQQSKMACRAKFEKIFSKFAYSNIMGMVVTQHLQFISTRVINNCSNIFIGKMVEPNAIAKIANMGVLSATDLQILFNQFKVGNFLDITKTKSLRELKLYGVFLPNDWKATGGAR